MAKKQAAGGLPARTSWFDEASQTPLIEGYARQLSSFIDTLADGRVEASEIKAQETRLVNLMRDIEPQLDDTMHAQITQLLCELTAYNLVQMLYAMQEARPRTVFRG
jgi:hypothetical protein